MGIETSIRTLVKKLSQEELREFYWFASRQSKANKSVQLFKLIRSEKYVSDSQICSRLKIKEPQLSTYKSRLSNLIKEYLAFKEFSGSERLKDFLKSKAFRKRGIKERNTGNPLSLNHEITSLGFENYHKAAFGSPLENIDLQNIQFHRDAIQLLQLRELRAKLATGLEEVYLPEPRISIIESLVRDYPLLQSPEQITHLRVKAEYHEVRRIIAVYKQEFDQARIHVEAFINLVSSGHSDLRDQLAVPLLENYERLLFIFETVNCFEEAHKLLIQLETIHFPDPLLKLKKEFILDFHMLLLETGGAGLNKGHVAVNNLKRKIPLYRKILPEGRYQKVLHSIAVYFTMAGEWGKG